ncbi:hypothetical protein Poli38472_010976 [Pythium oligandrum]|uniref:Carnitine O-acetyltransferase, mitochondrial n=1 Tax=Pythium oligandrum TaxID=41045 RepID=A0A8K1CG49_PYTOL|nr:hypothetical protein Poli38472_010976 [Pythium oligandrum]|eukprot:TMW61913.1 hypothetical protein Poli38472_010976 [Pythium oligandrum]
MYGPAGFRECHGDYRAESDLEVASQPLYRFQKSLPHLPVPSLESTVALYLETIAPLVTPVELENTKKLAAEFLKQGSIGHTLQQRLVQRAKDRHDTSYLAEWWNTGGYLQVRDPVVFNVSYFFHFADSVHPEQRSNIGRAAGLLRATLAFRQQVVDGSLEPEQLGPKKTPVCATAYKYMFNACRIPHREQDSYRIYDPARFQHVVVMRHNKFFKVNVVDAATGQWLSFEQLCHQLERVVAMAGSKESSVGVLSSQDRDAWADARDELVRTGNEAALQVIESAIVIVNLDDETPVTRAEMARGLWHGDGRNRFYDKCIQLVVYENGKAGLMGEHSMLDGMPMARYADFMLSRLHNKQIAFGPRGATTTELTRSLPLPEPISFRFSKQTLSNIVKAEHTFDQTVADHDLHVQSFYGYGSKQIKGFKCSPDAFAQMAIQLAYKKLFGINAATYEASQTRIFLHGRTETTRSCSKASAAFTDAMVDASGAYSVEEKRKLLLDAATSHVQYMKRAAQSCGVDRHLLGLRLLVQEGEKVPFFEDPVMARSRYWLISTSHLTNERFDGWGWGEVVPEGLGIAYSIKNGSIQFNIACRKPAYEAQWGARVGHLLEESLVEMQQLFATANKPAAPAAAKL